MASPSSSFPSLTTKGEDKYDMEVNNNNNFYCALDTKEGVK